ncbi:UDP-N-acetylmuramoyl-L-alanine--D-glutamate ligase [Vibrio maerlii]|uniref:UDP-N-acetylmuramoyl-L-alanine--D-glutamate ligase n=1 Tax=Vibrio maerlii TaxID=2231648 RepID=UPI000E3BFD80|nr:UDP-N-acetylmuramoyl-L-alanine--D-glutamate ligase [Vibrio maerlii]
MDRWQNINKVVVVGLGITGLSVVKHLQKHLSVEQIRVIDTRDNPPGADKLATGIGLHAGGWNTEWLFDADLLVVNPGIALATPELVEARSRGIEIVGDIELFAWAVNAPVLAITGSNGKSTVTDLTGVMAKASGLSVGVGGNIGVPALQLLEQDADLYVLELSSFQLETTSSLKLKAAAFLNLSEDHMDRYEGMTDYRQAKLRIFDHAEKVIVNRDDRQTYPDHPADFDIVTFGSDESEYGLRTTGSDNELLIDGRSIVKQSQLRLVGQHNLANALVVMALLQAANVELQDTLDALKNYTGLTHRCQVVAESNGIKWVNDSKATNVASTLAALAGLQLDGTLYLLVGGDGKGADFSELEPVLAELPVKLCCFGADGHQFMDLHSQSQLFDDMEQAISHFADKLVSGDMVLLSPACASFDQFPNFMARGDAFTELARQYSSK